MAPSEICRLLGEAKFKDMFLSLNAAAMKLSLGIFDALDNTCGNQTVYGGLSQPNYSLLAQILAGDALQVDTSKTVCNSYLGVEVGSTTDCGGRKLEHDVIDVTYTALVSGGATAVNDGPIGQNTAPLSSFPFMAPPK